MDITELQSQMAQAIANNDTKAIEELASQIVKGKSERHKAEAEALQKESEALAGAREEAGKLITKAVRTAYREIAKQVDFAALKATGYKFSHVVDGDVIEAGLIVPVIKAKRSSGGNGGGAGKTKDEYGMSLAEVYEKYHTAEDDAKLVEAEAKDKEASEKLGKTTNSNAWRVKNEVKKSAIASGLLQPTK